MKIRVSKILNKTDLGKSGSHGGLVVYKEDMNVLIDFFELPNEKQTFIDHTDGKKFAIRYADYSKNQSTPNDRVTPIGRYATKHDLQPGDMVSLEKQIDGNGNKYIIEYAKKINSVIFNGKSNKTVEVTNKPRFDEIIKNNLSLGSVKEVGTGDLEMQVLYNGIRGILTLKSDDDQFELYFNGDSIEAYRQYFELDTIVVPFELKKISTWKYSVHSDELEDIENEVADAELISSITTDNLMEAEDDYIPTPEDKKEPGNSGDRKAYKRSKAKAVKALKRAKFLCQFNTEHESFIRRNTALKYMEPHHLIPLQYYDEFEKSLDVEANIVSLCSECHNKIHYGEGAEKLISGLWEKKKDEIHKAGISTMKNGVEVDIDILFSFYGIK